MKVAFNYDMDLVEISPQATPPVCKILDYGKMKYDMQKKKNEAKKNQKVVEIKEIKLTPMIGVSDLNVKVSAIKKFLSAGNKVKLSLRFRGREISHQDLGKKVIDQVLSEICNLGKEENTPKLEGRQMVVTIAPVNAK